MCMCMTHEHVAYVFPLFEVEPQRLVDRLNTDAARNTEPENTL